MAKELDLYGGNNPANDKDARKNGVSQTTGQVKALNTGDTEVSLKKKLRKEVDEAWGGNHGLLGNLFNILGNILKTGGQLVGTVLTGVGEFFGGVIEGVKGFLGGIANAIISPKAGFKTIAGAVDERLGPLDNAITENTKHFEGLSSEVNDSIEKQKEIERLSEENAKEITRNREAAEKAIAERVAAEKTMNNEIATALRNAESAQKSADGKNTIYYDSKTPKSPKNGDTWFKQVTGGTQTLVYQDGKWVNKFDSAKADADLKAAREAIAQAEKNVAALKNETLPALDKDIANLRGDLALESDAREAVQQNLAKAEASVKDLVDRQLPAIRKTTSGLSSKLASEKTAREKAINNLNSSLTKAKGDLNGSLSTLQTNLDAAEKKLQNSIDTKATQATLNSVKKSLEKSLSDNKKALTTARDELDTLNVARPGNIWPDPHFQNPCWSGDKNRRSKPNNGGELQINAIGKQVGLYYQPKGRKDKSIMLERGGKYLLTATVYRSSKTPAGTTVSVHMRQPGKYVGRVAKLPTGPVGTSVESVILRIPGSIAGGGSTLGFFLESSVPEGRVTIWDVQIVRAADNAMIIDGAVTAAKVQAGAIETSKLAANAVTAAKIKAGAIVAGKLSANAVTAVNLQANAVTAGKIAANAISARELAANSVTATQIKAGEVKAGALAANSVTALNIVAGTITAKELGANSVTTKQLTANSVNASALQANSVKAEHLVANQITGNKLTANAITSREVKANSIMAEHMVIGGPANLIANGSFTEGKEPWHNALTVRKIGKTQALPPGDRYAITKAGQGTLAAHTGNQWFTVTPEGLYAFEIWMYADKPGSRFYLELRNQYGAHAGKALRDKVNAGDVTAGNGSYLMNNVAVRKGWNKYSTVYQVGKNTTRAKLGNFYFNHPNGSEQNARIAFAGISLRPMADADLIVDGAILAQHIKAGTITGKEIAANTINTRELAANAVTAKQISANAVTAAKIKAGTITGDRLKADTITSRQLATGAVKAVNIESGAITTKQLKAGTLHSDNFTFGNGWITNAMIKNAEIEASKIKSLDASKITTGTMSGKRIDADSITVRQLRANSIIPIGGSLIHHEPPPNDDTKPPEPIWWQVCENELAANYSGYPRPEGNPWRMARSASNKADSPYTPKRLVKVKPGQKYRLQFWCRSTRANTKMFIEMRDQNGNHAIKSGAVTGTVNTGNYQSAKAAKQPWPITDFTNSKVGSYLLNNFTLPTSITKVTSTIEFNEGVEYVYLARFYFNHPNGSAQGNQWLAGLSLDLDIPDQAQVDKIQTDAIKALEDGDALSRNFRKEQRRTNELVQAQVWQNRNMIELVDIRSPRLYGWAMKDVKTKKYCPWLPPDWGNYPKPYMECPFFEMYRAGNAVFIGFKGKTVGQFSIGINWDSGVIDRWSRPIEVDGMRVHHFTGGASHINIRSIEVSVYIESLCREVKAYGPDSYGDFAYDDPNKLIREHDNDWVTFKNGVTCSKTVHVVEGGKGQTVRAGGIIWGGKVYPKSACTFKEVADSKITYSVPDKSAVAARGTVPVISAK